MTKKELEDKLAEYVADNQEQFDIIKRKNTYIQLLENRITDLELQIDRLNFEIKIKDELMQEENELKKANKKRTK